MQNDDPQLPVSAIQQNKSSLQKAANRVCQQTVNINRVVFNVFEVGDAGMNQGVDGNVYRTFHGNKCYQLSIRMASANSGAFDGDVSEFTKEDAEEVRGRLEQVRDSFRFLK